jgi:protein CpxP
MRKLVLVAALVVSTLTFAQERGKKGKNLTPEQQVELHVKKMSKDLNLDANQQEQVKSILLENTKKREAKKAELKARRDKGEKLSKDEKATLENQMLDNQTEHKAQMKKILSAEQYIKWEEKFEKRSEKREERKHERKEKRKDSKPNKE